MPGADIMHDIRMAHGSASSHKGLPRWRVITQVVALTLIGVVALGLRLWPLRGAATGYDEGVYWLTLRSMASGHTLYAADFGSQPPGFFLSVFPLYLLFGQTLLAGRLAIIFYSLIGLIAVYYAARATGGPYAGLLACGLLAVDPLFMRESSTLQAEAPSLALALVAVAVAAYIPRKTGRWDYWLAFASGAALGLSIAAKLFAVVAVVPVVLYLTLPIDWGNVGGDALPALRMERWRDPTWWRSRAREIGLLIVGALLGFLLPLLPYLNDLGAVYDQSVAFHLAAGRLINHGLGFNLSLLDLVGRRDGAYFLAYVALAALVLAVWRRAWPILPSVAWALASLLFLLRQQPLFDQHVVLLAPPLALMGGLALPLALRSVRIGGTQILAAGRQRQERWMTTARIVSIVALLVFVLANCLRLDAQLDHVAAQPLSSTDAQMVRALDALTAPHDLVVVDDQKLAALANRDVPPALMDTSATRIQSGYLTTAEIEAIITRDSVRAVLFASQRFILLPGFQDWVAGHFHTAATFGPGQILYVRGP